MSYNGFKYKIGELVYLKFKHCFGIVIERKFDPMPFSNIQYFTYIILQNNKLTEYKDNEVAKVMHNIAILMDMDGTITPPRQMIELNVEKVLNKILDTGIHIGIVSGSGYEYILEQTNNLKFGQGYDNLHVLPCNGTQYHRQGQLIYTKSMVDEIGQQAYNKLINFLIKEQANLDYIPLTGTFFDYRKSMLNWCPIGRAATSKIRTEWETLDSENQLRLPILQRIKNFIKEKNIPVVVKLGGETSFDIYPIGWDKTYSFKVFEGKKIYFIGDRCTSTGNDYEAFVKAGLNGYNTKGPSETIQILNNILKENS